MGLRDTMNVSVEEMLASFLFIIGQNLRYIQAQDRFKRSRFSISTSFNTILKVLNVFAPSYMAKPTLVVPTKIKDNTRFYPYFKDCVGAIDGTHIPAMITGKETASYLDCGFANCRNCFALFRSTRYHLQDFRGQGKDPNNQNELFNHRHSSLRNKDVLEENGIDESGDEKNKRMKRVKVLKNNKEYLLIIGEQQ
ncbi:unnamed protein product [Arabidopsis thaliana]|uniref:DUF8040 domain-containing protein n=1 Tax=Arabidopsis thaliana TaxID=3702 RepID=Q9LS62_ARATH|nr:unnamed protein product [Arabidopsis thaliana]